MQGIVLVRRSLRQVFGDWRYGAAAAAAALAVFALSVWLRNVSLIAMAFTSPLFSAGDRLLLLFRLLGGIATADTVLAAAMMISVALLFGVNIALIAYYFIQRRRLPAAKESATTIGGVAAAVFGVGCSACGTLVLGAILSSAGAAGLLALLPLGGGEFLLLSIALLAASIYWIGGSIQTSTVCTPSELTVLHPSNS